MPKLTIADQNLHSDWKTAKGKAAEFMKANKLNFNGGLGPALNTLCQKWGTPAGVAAAAKVKTIATSYRIKVDNSKALPAFKVVLLIELQKILELAAKKQDR